MIGLVQIAKKEKKKESADEDTQAGLHVCPAMPRQPIRKTDRCQVQVFV